MGNTGPISAQPSRTRDMRDAIDSRRHFGSQRPLAHHVARSWERCLVDYKLDPDQQRKPQNVSNYELEQRRHENSEFLGIAATEISNLYQQISGSGSAILLADKDGVIMNVVGDSRFLEKTRRQGFAEGVVWSEQSAGTNGLGTCLAERSPVLIHHHDHFFPRYCQLTCAAAPIFDHTGELLGVLDASSDSPLAQQYSVALVRMSAQIIENRVFMSNCSPHYLVRFHSRLEFVGAIGEGVIAFDTEGDIKAMNGTAQLQFDEDWQHGVSKASIDDFFDSSIPQMLHMAHRHEHPVVQLRCARSGRHFYASLHAPTENSAGPNLYIPRSHKPIAKSRLEPLQHCASDPMDSELSLDCFEFGDNEIKTSLSMAGRALKKEAAPILISGHTGSGKTSLAQALHKQYVGADKPFTRINCASLRPDTVDKHLFDSDGSLCRAHEGTLFLDEIGDMPMDVQPVFLHILERHCKENCNTGNLLNRRFQLICATQRDLTQAVNEGKFRSDLYYRICGVPIDLKSFAQRSDTEALIANTYRLNSDREQAIDSRSLQLLTQSSWPGNIRQLISVIVRAQLLADDGVPSTQQFAQALAQQPNIQPECNQPPTLCCDDTSEEEFSPLEVAERQTLLGALSEHNWSVSDVAKSLGLSRNTIYRKMSKYQLPAKRTGNKSARDESLEH